MRRKWKATGQGVTKVPAHLKKIVPVKQPSKGGRPTFYDKTRHPQMAYLVISNFGATLEQLAPILGVEPCTINLWSFKHEAFRQAIQHGRWHWSMDTIEASLVKRATGYEVIEITEEEVFVDIPIDMMEDNSIGEDGKNRGDTCNARTRKIKMPGTKVTRKNRHIPASVPAILYFLNNRDPDNWKHVRHIEQHHDFKGVAVPDFIGNVIEVNPREQVANILKDLPEEKLVAMRKLHDELAVITEQMNEANAPAETTNMEDIYNEVITGMKEDE